MKKNLFGIITSLLLFGSTAVQAQDDLNALLNETNETPKKEFTSAIFKGTRLINLHTVEVGGKRSLDFRIAHRFGDLNGGLYESFGLDGGASIRLGLEYSYDGRLQFGVGRTNIDKTGDLFAKYRLLRQTTNNKNPLSITLFAGMYYTMLKDPNKALGGKDKYENDNNRLSYAYQIIFARKFSERFSFQIAPTMVHFNLVEKLSDKNDMYAVCAATRFKFTKRFALTAEYCWRATEWSRDTYYDSFALGFDIETGGHVFQLQVVNSLGVLENQFIPKTNTKWSNGGIRLGFNISRMFNI
jgi:hypothetical protein